MATKQIVAAQPLTSSGATKGKPTVIRLPSDGRRVGRSQRPGNPKNPFFKEDVAGKYESVIASPMRICLSGFGLTLFVC